MKTFLWTTLFWILAAIAALLCLGFWNLWTQVLDNWWIAKFLPNNLQSESCESVVASALENVDWCETAKNYGCYPTATNGETTEESVNLQELIDSLNVLSTNQETIYNQMNTYYSSIMQNFSTLAEMYYSAPANVVVDEEPVVDEREQQRLELQAQIEALQYQMENL